MEKTDLLSQSVSKVYGVGPQYVKRLNKLGVSTIEDLLCYYPKKYEDLTQVKKVSELKEDDTVQTVKVRLNDLTNTRTRRGMVLTKGSFEDDSGIGQVIWFNQPFLQNAFQSEKEYLLTGKVKEGYIGPLFQSPKYEPVKEEQLHAGRIVPVYHETEGLSSKWLRYKMSIVLPAAEKLAETLPESILQSQKLIGIQEATRQIHFPSSKESLRQARERIAFEEVFLVQLIALGNKREWEKHDAPKISFNKTLAQDFVRSLPFQLTKTQKVSAWEILKDLEKTVPMNRLLEGDVGSGKTVVAALASLMTVKNKYQVALMAPTEVLAHQHYHTIRKVLKPFEIKVGLLTSKEVIDSNGKKVTKKDLIKEVANHKIDLLIGTHALIEKNVEFKNLGLVIIDEQHRFGVEQRSALHAKGKSPHFLSMTATPIPRTLALSMFGDLDISIISELPKGRKKILTKVVSDAKRQAAYKFIHDKVKEGPPRRAEGSPSARQSRQVFVICPLIEKSDKLGVKAATLEYEKLARNIFPDLKVGLLHGRLKKDEKIRVMELFRQGKIDILVSTSVVEVGVDIPNATIMMIEGAERFGLAQLHQFRGRVGRNKYQSYCFLFPTEIESSSLTRLRSLETIDDGFKLAEIDLENRGPGEVYGKSQSGYFYEFQIANPTDIVLTQKARKEAEKILDEDSELNKYPVLKRKVKSIKLLMHRE